MNTRARIHDLAMSTITAAGVPNLVSMRPAIVLERIARGAGATNWYSVSSVADLDLLGSRMTPGSSVSFYFDDRLAWRALDDGTQRALVDLIESDGDIVVGSSTQGIDLDVVIVSGRSELSEVAKQLGSRPVLVGAFPGPDDDGVNAVTLDLPDDDGVLRQHPH